MARNRSFVAEVVYETSGHETKSLFVSYEDASPSASAHRALADYRHLQIKRVLVYEFVGSYRAVTSLDEEGGTKG